MTEQELRALVNRLARWIFERRRQLRLEDQMELDHLLLDVDRALLGRSIADVARERYREERS